MVKEYIATLRNYGVAVALDDFGTGYSSLNYLDQFEFDCLKIDKSFVDDLESHHKKNLILKSIVDLAKSLKMKVTAEGVNYSHQINKLIMEGA